MFKSAYLQLMILLWIPVQVVVFLPIKSSWIKNAQKQSLSTFYVVAFLSSTHLFTVWCTQICAIWNFSLFIWLPKEHNHTYIFIVPGNIAMNHIHPFKRTHTFFSDSLLCEKFLVRTKPWIHRPYLLVYFSRSSDLCFWWKSQRKYEYLNFVMPLLLHI